MSIENSAKQVLLANRKETQGYMYTTPSTNTYPYQWLWDSCFHAIALSHFEPSAGKEELKSLLSKQFSDGMVPHIIYWVPGDIARFDWGVEGTSAITQPPMLAYAALQLHEREPDEVFLRTVYPKLLAFYRFLISERDIGDRHLIGIINPDESGEDNSPRFDDALGATADMSYESLLDLRKRLVVDNIACGFEAEKCSSKFFWAQDVPFNAIMVENLHALAKIASMLGESADEYYVITQADAIAASMRENMLEDGLCWSLTGTDFKKSKIATWAHFAPLFAGLYTADEAENVVRKHLLNPDTFASPLGIRTVSAQEPAYRANGFTEGFSWRGSIWMVPHWLVYKGLVRYGFTAEAADLYSKSVSLLESTGFRECFNPETGEGQGAHGFTWGALILDMK